MGKALVLVGLGIAALGLAVMLGVPLGRLPGDILVRRGNFSFYFPLTTSINLEAIRSIGRTSTAAFNVAAALGMPYTALLN